MVHRSPLIIMVIASVLLLGAVGLIGCGSTGSTSTTLSPGTGATVPPPSGGTTSAETTASVGTTVLGGQTPALTFLGPVNLDTWRALREIVMDAGDDGQKVLDEAAGLAVGPPVEVGIAELDAVRGIGYAAGATTSQPIGVAIDVDGKQVVVFAFSVIGTPDATTIVGFERQTNLVGLVEGPLPISDSTGNMTTIPSP